MALRPIVVVGDDSDHQLRETGRAQREIPGGSLDGRRETIGAAALRAAGAQRTLRDHLRHHETNFLDTLRGKLGLGYR